MGKEKSTEDKLRIIWLESRVLCLFVFPKKSNWGYRMKNLVYIILQTILCKGHGKKERERARQCLEKAPHHSSFHKLCAAGPKLGGLLRRFHLPSGGTEPSLQSPNVYCRFSSADRMSLWVKTRSFGSFVESHVAPTVLHAACEINYSLDQDIYCRTKVSVKSGARNSYCFAKTQITLFLQVNTKGKIVFLVNKALGTIFCGSIGGT